MRRRVFTGLVVVCLLFLFARPKFAQLPLPGSSSGAGTPGGVLVDYQKTTTAITISVATDTTLYSTSAPALAAGSCFEVRVSFTLGNGGAQTLTEKLFYGSSSVTVTTSNGYTGQQFYSAPIFICNDPGSQTSQQVTFPLRWNVNGGTGAVFPGTSGYVGAVTAIATTASSPQTIKYTISTGAGAPTMTGFAWEIKTIHP